MIDILIHFLIRWYKTIPENNTVFADDSCPSLLVILE